MMSQIKQVKSLLKLINGHCCSIFSITMFLRIFMVPFHKFVGNFSFIQKEPRQVAMQTRQYQFYLSITH